MTRHARIFAPLTGVRVLDLADEQACFCAGLLADMGADVVMVEPPEGDASRRIGPFLQDGSSLFFQYHNANKRGVTLELDRPEDRECFLRLVKTADVVVESFPPGELHDRGLGYPMLRRENPGLVMVSVTGFGQTGPRRKLRSCDLVAAAYGGQMYVTGDSDGPPLHAFGEQTASIASLYATLGVLLSLRERDRGAGGRHIDIATQEAVISTLDYVLVRVIFEGIVSARQGSLHWNQAFDIFPCRDGYIMLSLHSHWETLSQWLQQEGMAADLTSSLWMDPAYRRQNIEHLAAVVGRWTRNHSVAELFTTAQLMRMPWAPVVSMDEVIKSPQLKARHFFGEIGQAGAASEPSCPRLPFKLAGMSLPPRRSAPGLGQDNASMLTGDPWPSRTEASHQKVDSEKLSAAEKPKGPLAGIRVVDFTWVLAGPYATRILGDFGAEVIKVQTRRLARETEDNSKGYFVHWNRNKRSIILNMDHAKARGLLLRLVALSDVVMENFSPRVMINWGLSYETLQVAQPDLVMLSLSAMGGSGPWRDYVGFGPTIQALSGLSALTSRAEGPPLGIGYSHADAVAGLFSALAVTAALRVRDRTGQGVHIDLSEYESMCALLGPALMNTLHSGENPLPVGTGSSHLQAAPYGCYPCRGEDRWCVIAVFSDAQWAILCQTAARRDWLSDPRFATYENRLCHRGELDVEITSWTSRQDPGTLVDRLQRAGLAAGVVQDASDIARDSHLAARGFFASLEHAVMGRITADASPIHFGNTRTAGWKAAPLLGEANRNIFLDLLGLTEDELADLEAEGIVH